MSIVHFRYLSFYVCVCAVSREEQGIDARHDGRKITGIREEIDAEISTVSGSMLKSSQVKSSQVNQSIRAFVASADNG